MKVCKKHDIASENDIPCWKCEQEKSQPQSRNQPQPKAGESRKIG